MHSMGSNKIKAIEQQDLCITTAQTEQPVINMVKTLKLESLEERSNTIRLCILSTFQLDLIDVTHTSPTTMNPNANRTRDKTVSTKKEPV